MLQGQLHSDIFYSQYHFSISQKGDPTFAPTTVAPAMISRATERLRVRAMIGFWVRGRVRIKIRIRVRVR